MTESDNQLQDIIDEDLYEELDEAEMYEIIQEERRKSIQQKATEEEAEPQKRKFPKWIFWLVALAMFIQVIAIIPQTFSIPAIDFLVTSARLSTDPVIDEYQESVVVVETEDGKGTGFSISADGIIITNHHVIEDDNQITVAFPEEGLFDAELIVSYPDVDLAILDVDGNELPYLTLAEQTTFESDERIQFIGNPLRFNGIANEGNIIGYTSLDSWDEQVLMLEAPVYRGNSGSPVINLDGEVIAVIFATMTHEEHGKVGLAVPIDYYYEKKAENNSP